MTEPFPSLSSSPPRSVAPFRGHAPRIGRSTAFSGIIFLLTFPGGLAMLNLWFGLTGGDDGLVVTGAGLLVVWFMMTLLVWFAIWASVARLEQALRHGHSCPGQLGFTGQSYVVSFRDAAGHDRVAFLGLGSRAPEFWGSGAMTVLHDPNQPNRIAVFSEPKDKFMLVDIRPPKA